MTREAEAESQLERAIYHLPQLVQWLPEEPRSIFQRLIHVSSSTGHLVPPVAMNDWILKFFGSLEAVESQVIIKTTNLVTLEGALFNKLRASRPMPSRTPGDLLAAINQTLDDPFCHPETGTPEDVFGRVRGRHSVTASNIAKYDAFHGLVIFDHHNPLILSEEGVRDYLEVGHRWAGRVVQEDPAARYFFFMWNALWKSGASIIHGHAQIACTREMHYSRVEALRRAALHYRQATGANYFTDLVRAHEALGLALDHREAKVVVSLTPVREKEVLILAPGLAGALPDALYRVLDCFIGELGVTSFNVVIYMPPLLETPEDWSGFPYMARIVDRGDPMNRTNDVGAMELYATPVISTDPFRVLEALQARFGQG